MIFNDLLNDDYQRMFIDNIYHLYSGNLIGIEKLSFE
jgi:hypothetical protein